MLPPMSQESWTIIGVGVLLLGVMVTGQIRTQSAIDSVRNSVVQLGNRVSQLEDRMSQLEYQMSQLESRIAVVEFILQDRLPKVAGSDAPAD